MPSEPRIERCTEKIRKTPERPRRLVGHLGLMRHASLHFYYLRYIFFAAANKHTHPARNATPPKGVTAPSPRHPVSASA